MEGMTADSSRTPIARDLAPVEQGAGKEATRFQILYADPPWRMGGSGKGAPPYPMMATRDICALPVGRLATPKLAAAEILSLLPSTTTLK